MLNTGYFSRRLEADVGGDVRYTRMMRCSVATDLLNRVFMIPAYEEMSEHIIRGLLAKNLCAQPQTSEIEMQPTALIRTTRRR